VKSENPQKLYDDIYIDDNELSCSFYIDDYKDIDEEENCISCFHSDGKYCYCKNIYINKHSPTCWCYRDCFTMRACSEFQDDYDDVYDNFD
jgi:hypothetical protein